MRIQNRSRAIASLCKALLLVQLLVGGAAEAAGSPPEHVLTQRELLDMMVGAAIQSSRSAATAEMLQRMQEALAEGRTFRMVAVKDVPDDWLAVVPSGVGGGGSWDYVTERIRKQGVPTEREPMLLAVHALSAHMGKSFQGVVRSEAGWATIDALLIANALGVPVVDGCMTGRSVPSMQQSTTFINGISGAPGALATSWGDVVIVSKAVDDYRLEDLARGISVASGGSVELASNVLSGAQIRRAIIPGAFSQAIQFGRAVREAREEGRDPVAALLAVSGGFRLFQGRVSRSDMKREGGFNWVDVEMQGTGEFEGHTYKIFVKNENLVTWLDGKPDAMAPDFIANLDPVTGQAISSEGIGIGGYPMNAEVVMVGIPASPLWRTEAGTRIVGPRAFGFDFDYEPVESIQRRRPRSARQQVP
jgi:uncharacterized protein